MMFLLTLFATGRRSEPDQVILNASKVTGHGADDLLPVVHLYQVSLSATELSTFLVMQMEGCSHFHWIVRNLIADIYWNLISSNRLAIFTSDSYSRLIYDW